MEECELCGNPMTHIYGVEIEGVEMRVCAKCAAGKRVAYKEDPAEKGNARPLPFQAKKAKEEAEMVDNYGRIIKEARERMKLPLKVLAEMISEKETLLYRVENQQTVPSMALTKKLERALGIKLEQQGDNSEQKHVRSKKEEATLGEFID